MTSKFMTDPQDPWDSFLNTSGAEFYGSFAGTGPELKYAGSPVAAGQFGTWTPIGAEQTASGYEVAWKFPSSDQYTVWNTDSNGSFGSNTGAVSGTSSILESLESSFHQDLNGDGLIGVPAFQELSSKRLDRPSWCRLALITFSTASVVGLGPL